MPLCSRRGADPLGQGSLAGGWPAEQVSLRRMEPEATDGGKVGWALDSLGDDAGPEIQGERQERADGDAPGVIVGDSVY